jgi:hypothetical protein
MGFPAQLASLPLDQINPKSRISIRWDFKKVGVVRRGDRQRYIERSATDVLVRNVFRWRVEQRTAMSE